MLQWRTRHVQNWAYDGHTENVRQCLVHSRRDAFELADPDGGIPKTALHQVAESATSGPLMKDINFDRLCDTKQRLARNAPFYTRDGASEHPELADSHGT